jgi:hypothetical protein
MLSVQSAPQPSQPPVSAYPSSNFSSDGVASSQPSQTQGASAPAAAPSQGSAANAGSDAPSAPPLISFDMGPSTAPPQPWWSESRPGTAVPGPVAAGPAAAAGPASTPGKKAGAQGGGEDDSNVCVICMEEEATAGYLHGDS